MANPLTVEIIDPQALSPAARERFTEDLYTTHQRIFDGVDRDAFSAYVIDPPALRTRIQVFRTGALIVGYAAFHVFERSVGGRPGLVLRAEVGLLPAYRRRTRFGWFLAREALGVAIRNPGTAIWGLSCATNPATYRSIARHADQFWPHWERPTPPPLRQLMDELAQQFCLRSVDPARPGVYQVGWKTRQNDSEIQRWRGCSHPASQLYVQRNPGYPDGHGLLVLIPITALGMMRAGLRIAAHRLGRWLGHRPTRALAPARLRDAESSSS